MRLFCETASDQILFAPRQIAVHTEQAGCKPIGMHVLVAATCGHVSCLPTWFEVCAMTESSHVQIICRQLAKQRKKQLASLSGALESGKNSKFKERSSWQIWQNSNLERKKQLANPSASSKLSPAPEQAMAFSSCLQLLHLRGCGSLSWRNMAPLCNHRSDPRLQTVQQFGSLSHSAAN